MQPGEEQSITTDLPGFCPAVWRPDAFRPLAALGPDPLSWSSGTLATKRFYLPFFRKTNQGKSYLVIGFTNALPFYSTSSALTFFTAVKPSLAPKATDSVVAIDSVSVDADYDNGTLARYGAPRSRRETTYHIAREAREEARESRRSGADRGRLMRLHTAILPEGDIHARECTEGPGKPGRNGTDLSAAGEAGPSRHACGVRLRSHTRGAAVGGGPQASDCRDE